MVTYFNQTADISRTYKGYFTIIDSSVRFRYKLLQDVTISTLADIEKIYNDTGAKVILSIGDSSTFTLTTKKSADLWDTTAATTTNKVRTIGFYQNKIINDRVIPEATFEGVSETDASSNRFIVVTFDAFILSIDDTRNSTTGAPEVVISGEIKSLTTSKRQSSAPT